MTETQVLPAAQAVELAAGLRDLEWSWQLADGPALAARFGWEIVASEPEWIALDTDFGAERVEVYGTDGTARRIEVQIADFAKDFDDPELPARLRDTFADFTADFTAVLGAPTRRIPGANPEVRWAGASHSLVLKALPFTVKLTLIENAALASHDAIIASEAEEDYE